MFSLHNAIVWIVCVILSLVTAYAFLDGFIPGLINGMAWGCIAISLCE